MNKCVLVFILLSLIACKPEKVSNNKVVTFRTAEGETMGTYYRVSYSDTILYKSAIDSILNLVNQEVSSYIPNSTISRFNKSKEGIVLDRGIFTENLAISRKIYLESGGYYDPTVMPLVNYWGFGYKGKIPIKKIDSLKIKNLMLGVGMDKVNIIEQGGRIAVKKVLPSVELDFSSVAKGYAVDLIGSFLRTQGIENFLVDIGGEMAFRGLNPKGKPWTIGINTPKEGADFNESIQYVQFSEKAIATSGNYRNFYDVDGQRYSHTINPKTGFPERSDLLSASIVAGSCAVADAYATACMVLGLVKAEELIKNNQNLSACLIYNSGDKLAVKYINNFENYIIF